MKLFGSNPANESQSMNFAGSSQELDLPLKSAFDVLTVPPAPGPIAPEHYEAVLALLPHSGNSSKISITITDGPKKRAD